MTPRAALLACFARLQASILTSCDEIRRTRPELFDHDAHVDLDAERIAVLEVHVRLGLLCIAIERHCALEGGDS